MDYKKIIQKNSKRLYRVPKKYKYLNQLFQGEIRDLYFSIMHFIQDKEIYRFHGKISFHLATSDIIRLRGKGSPETANHYINYLCAMGLIRKLQHLKEDPTDINGKFLKGKPKTTRPINTFYFYSFDPNGEILSGIEARCRTLVEHGITKANISKDYLIIKGLEDLSKELYEDTNSAIEWKSESYCRIYNFLNDLIQDKGYATKQDLIKGLILNQAYNEAAINKVLRQCRDLIHQDFRYQRPTKAMKEQYQLDSDSWIFTIPKDLQNQQE